MSQDDSQGEIRPNPRQEILEGVSCELLAAADLAEQLLERHDDAALAALRAALPGIAMMLNAVEGGVDET